MNKFEKGTPAFKVVAMCMAMPSHEVSQRDVMQKITCTIAEELDRLGKAEAQHGERIEQLELELAELQQLCAELVEAMTPAPAPVEGDDPPPVTGEEPTGEDTPPAE